MHHPEKKNDLNKDKDLGKKEQTPPVRDKEDKGTRRLPDSKYRVESEVVE